MNKEIQKYNQSLEEVEIFNQLATIIDKNLNDAESKIWHAHPVWFLNGNPIVGYSKQKAGVRLLFWSGADFDENDLNIRGEKFKDASIFYNAAEEVNYPAASNGASQMMIKTYRNKTPQEAGNSPLRN